MKDLIALLEEMGHVGELARLIYVYKELGNDSIGRRELIELSNRTAGAIYRYPNPIVAIELALYLGLIRQQGSTIYLTRKGKQFKTIPSSQNFELRDSQARIFLALTLDDTSFRKSIRDLLGEFHQGTDNLLTARLPLSNVTRESLTVSKILQQVGALEIRGESLVVRADFESVLPVGFIESTVKLSEDELWARLEKQQLRAREAEEFVLKMEKKRLLDLGQQELAELVTRVSASNVSAGFDISSFEEDGSPRYIEVKSSTGYRIHYIWSLNERVYAEKVKERYWIYFVPLSFGLPNTSPPIYIIQNPVKIIRSGKLIEEPSSFTVYDSEQRIIIKTSQTDSNSHFFIQWPT